MDADRLSSAWVEAVAIVGGAREAAARSAEDLVRRYGEPHRHYHNREHVLAVLATIDHGAADDDVACQILLDADLAILAALPVRYDAYAHAVRQEYAAVPDDVWQLGRGAVLRRLLDKDPLYLTLAARERWETSARENLRRELAALG